MKPDFSRIRFAHQSPLARSKRRPRGAPGLRAFLADIEADLAAQGLLPSGTDNEPKTISSISPAAANAYRLWKIAERRMSKPPQTDEAAYEWLDLHPEHLSDDYKLPALETWTRYVRQARHATG